MKTIRDFLLCCIAAGFMWGVIFYGIGLHQEAVARQEKPRWEQGATGHASSGYGYYSRREGRGR